MKRLNDGPRMCVSSKAVDSAHLEQRDSGFDSRRVPFSSYSSVICP